MQPNANVLTTLAVISGIVLAPVRTCAQVSSELSERRSRLAAVKPGTTTQQVLRDLGKPDEIRPVGASGLLDGIRISRSAPGSDGQEAEVERWVYGALGKGMFGATGYLSVSRGGVVVGATTADSFCCPGAVVPKLIHSSSDAAVESPGSLVCRIMAIERVRATGYTPDRLRLTVEIANNGPKQFLIKHPAATEIRRLLIIEVCDAIGVLLYRDDLARYSSYDPHGASRTLSVASGGKQSETFCVSIVSGFGRLPSGAYFLRVYFPLSNGNYYPSNRVRFEVSEDRTK